MKKYLAALCITIGTVFGAELASGSDTGVSQLPKILFLSLIKITQEIMCKLVMGY